MKKFKLIKALSVIFALSLSVFCIASCALTEETEESKENPSVTESSGGSVVDPFDDSDDESVETVKYTITWLDEDGTELKKTTVDENSVPVYGTENPTKAADNTYTYTFAGWDKEPAAATEDATYTATYTGTYIEYTITFVLGNGQDNVVYKLHYDDTVTVPENPEKASDLKFDYTFKSWDKEVAKVTDDATYTAEYDETYIDYTITFVDYSGETISEKNDYHYDDIVTVPNHTVLAGYTFGWDETPAEKCVGNATYTETKTPNTDTAYTVRHHFATVADPADENDYVVKEVAAEGTTEASTSATAQNVYNHTARPFDQETVAADGSTVVDIYYDMDNESVLSLYLIDLAELSYTGASEISTDATGKLVVSIPSGTADANLDIPLPASWEDPLKNYAEIVTRATTHTSATSDQWNSQWVGYKNAEGTSIKSTFINTADSYVSVRATASAYDELPACIIEEGGNLYLRIYLHYHTGVWLGMTFTVSDITLGEPISKDRTTLNFNVDKVSVENGSSLSTSEDTITVNNGSATGYWANTVLTISIPDAWEEGLRAGATVSAKAKAHRVVDSNSIGAYFTNRPSETRQWLNTANSYYTISDSTTVEGELPAFVYKEDDKLYLQITCHCHPGVYSAGSLQYTVTEVSISWDKPASWNNGTLQWATMDVAYGDAFQLSSGKYRSDGTTQQYCYYEYAAGRNAITFEIADYNWGDFNSLLRIQLQYNGVVYTYDQTNNVWKNESDEVNENIKMYRANGSEVTNLADVPTKVNGKTGELVKFVITGISTDLRILNNPPKTANDNGASEDSMVCTTKKSATWYKA